MLNIGLRTCYIPTEGYLPVRYGIKFPSVIKVLQQESKVKSGLEPVMSDHLLPLFSHHI